MDTPRALLSTKDVTSGSRLLTLVGIVVVIASLYFGRQVLIPLALAVVLAFLLTPIVGLVERCRLGRKAQERVGLGCADMIGTSLSQMILLIGQ